MNLRVIVNSHAGTGATHARSARERLPDLLDELGGRVELTFAGPDNLEQLLVRARDGTWDCVVVGGGDGTIGTAARLFAGSRTPLAILPMGTFNYFARFLDLPLNIEQAVRALPEAAIESCDLVEVNGRLFLSHSAIGNFPRYIMERAILQRNRGLSKIPAMLGALVKTFLRHRVLVITMAVNGNERVVPTPSLVIGNTPGVLSPLFAGEDRAALRDGRFSLFIGRRLSRWTTAWATMESFLGKVDTPSDYEHMELSQCSVDAPNHSLLVTLDGELAVMRPPLSFRIRPGLLRLLASPT
jgi:diacylglycerol kinase family enzyme